MEHIIKQNDDLQVEKMGTYLQGKTIALCVTGGIAMMESPKIARHLRRYGASVKAYMTPMAAKMMNSMFFEWATGQTVVDDFVGLAEHICLDDLVLIAPATQSTISKIMCGISDNVVTTLAGSALGQGIPVYMAPTMHESMWHNPFLQQNLSQAEKYGVHIIEPRFSEKKAKIPKLDTIVAAVCRGLAKHDDPIKGANVLITGGNTPGRIDDIRKIDNIFKGKLAVEIAKDIYHRGGNPKLLLSKTTSVPEYIDVAYHKDFAEYYTNVFSELDKGYDSFISSAAVADYIPAHYIPGKIPSRGKLENIEMKETPKVIQEVRERYPDIYMVTFKYEDGKSVEELLEIARRRIEQGYNIVVANLKQEMEPVHKAYIVGREGVLSEPEGKQEIAREIVDVVGKKF